MKFIEPNLETILAHLDKLDKDAKPVWGTMNAQQMVEHLTDVVNAPKNHSEIKILGTDEQVKKSFAFLLSDEPFHRNIKAPFLTDKVVLRNSEIELAIDELAEEWMNFESFFEDNHEKMTPHPYFGHLNYEQWLLFQSKHFTHHLTQFGIEIT